MNISSIKKLVESGVTIEQLQQAETDLMEGNVLAIEVEGADEGEQLTHIIAASEILNDMHRNNIAMPLALRNYTSRVRNSIN